MSVAHRRRTGLSLVLLLLALPGGTVRADLVYLSAERWVSAFGRVEPNTLPPVEDSDREDAPPGFAPFSGTAQVDVVTNEILSGGPNTQSAVVTITQASTLLDRRIESLVRTRIHIGETIQGFEIADGQSFLRVTFRLDEPHAYTSLNFAKFLSSTVSLTDDLRGTTVDLNRVIFNEGLLAPGQYTLTQSIRHTSPVLMNELVNHDFSIDFTPVPLPAAVWPAAVVLAAVPVARRVSRSAPA